MLKEPAPGSQGFCQGATPFSSICTMLSVTSCRKSRGEVFSVCGRPAVCADGLAISIAHRFHPKPRLQRSRSQESRFQTPIVLGFRRQGRPGLFRDQFCQLLDCSRLSSNRNPGRRGFKLKGAGERLSEHPNRSKRSVKGISCIFVLTRILNCGAISQPFATFGETNCGT